MNPEFLPTLAAGILFGLVGIVAVGYGKMKDTISPKVIGTLLMVFPYFTPGLVLTCAVGGVLTVCLFVFRD